MGPAPEYIESLYTEFAKDSTTVDPEWKKFFEGYDFALGSAPTNGNGTASAGTPEQLAKEIGVFELDTRLSQKGASCRNHQPYTHKERPSSAVGTGTL